MRLHVVRKRERERERAVLGRGTVGGEMRGTGGAKAGGGGRFLSFSRISLPS